MFVFLAGLVRRDLLVGLQFWYQKEPLAILGSWPIPFGETPRSYYLMFDILGQLPERCLAAQPGPYPTCALALEVSSRVPQLNVEQCTREGGVSIARLGVRTFQKTHVQLGAQDVMRMCSYRQRTTSSINNSSLFMHEVAI